MLWKKYILDETEFGIFTKGLKHGISIMETMHFIYKIQVPKVHEITYAHLLCYLRPQKYQSHILIIMIGVGKIDCPINL